MNPNRDKIIALTNRVALVAMILLLYWVFIFISIKDKKVILSCTDSQRYGKLGL